jgi:hypothetical protein
LRAGLDDPGSERGGGVGDVEKGVEEGADLDLRGRLGGLVVPFEIHDN